MANPGEFVLQNMLMQPQVYCSDDEALPIAKRMLMATFFFAKTPYPMATDLEIWSTKPLDTKDSHGAQTCAKTGLCVPLHAQARFRGRVYDSRWVPEDNHDGF